MAKKPTEAKTKDLKVIDIHLTKICISKSNPRKSIDTNAIAYLAESMEEQGLLQPITVRPDADGFEIVAGERRYRAAKKLNWITIPAIVRQVSDEEMLELQVLENLQREDINPMDEAAAFATLIKKEDIDWLAAKIHKSCRYVQDRLKLNNLIDPAKTLLSKGHLPLGHAVLISKLTPEYQIKALDECFPMLDIESEPSWEEDELICKATLHDLKDEINDMFAYFSLAKFVPADKFLNKEAGACTECPHRTINNLLLFSDITSEDRCTNSSCFRAKNEQQVINNIEQAKRLHKGIKEGSVDYNRRVKVGGKLMDNYSDKPAKGLTPVVITKADSLRSEAVGKVVYVDLSEATEKKVNKLAPAPAEPEPFNPEDYRDELNKLMNERYLLMKKYYEYPVTDDMANSLIKDMIKSKLMSCDTIYLHVMASMCNVIDLSIEDAFMEGKRIDDLGWKERQEAEKRLIELMANELSVGDLIQAQQIANNIDDIDWIDDPEEWPNQDLYKFLQTIQFKA